MDVDILSSHSRCPPLFILLFLEPPDIDMPPYGRAELWGCSRAEVHGEPVWVRGRCVDPRALVVFSFYVIFYLALGLTCCFGFVHARLQVGTHGRGTSASPVPSWMQPRRS